MFCFIKRTETLEETIRPTIEIFGFQNFFKKSIKLCLLSLENEIRFF